jgi:hypothetical protein
MFGGRSNGKGGNGKGGKGGSGGDNGKSGGSGGGGLDLEVLDLDPAHYDSEADLRRLFRLPAGGALSEADMLRAKRTALMTHPDKSRLDSRYYLFFREAYARLLARYEAAAKTTRRVAAAEYRPEVDADAGADAAARAAAVAGLRGEGFGAWFNEAFEARRPARAGGHGDWLRSDADFVPAEAVAGGDVSAAVGAVKRRLQAQQVVEYRGVAALPSASSAGGAWLLEEEEGAAAESLAGAGYTDLRRAYTQTLLGGGPEEEVAARPATLQALERQRAEAGRADEAARREAARLAEREAEAAEAAARRRAARLAEQEAAARAAEGRFWSGLLRIGG